MMTINLADVSIRSMNDGPIRFLLIAEAISNVFFLLIIFLYPSTLIKLLFQSNKRIDSLTIDFLFWWASWLVALTILMFIAGFRTTQVSIRRFLYWILFSSEILLAFLLVQTENRTEYSISFAAILLMICFARLVVLFVKRSWFGVDLLDIDLNQIKTKSN